MRFLVTPISLVRVQSKRRAALGPARSWALLWALVMALALAASGCVWAPYAPRDRTKLGPPGESQPVPGADANPLDTPRRQPVVCSPQGDPLVETDETRACRADPECRLVCASAEDALEAR